MVRNGWTGQDRIGVARLGTEWTGRSGRDGIGADWGDGQQRNGEELQGQAWRGAERTGLEWL